jgi:hypothetical protein
MSALTLSSIKLRLSGDGGGAPPPSLVLFLRIVVF